MHGAYAIILLSLGAAGLIAFAGWLVINHRSSPMERERKRRAFLHLTGRMADAEVLDLDASLLLYSYEVGGVVYSTTQDISQLCEQLPRDPQLIIGPATVKYSQRNPANSIVVSEEWSGLRSRRRIVLERRGA